jgi:CBS domain-containing protein
LAEIAEIMREEDTGAVPICENGKAVGMITDRDIVMRTLAQDVDPNQVLAQDIMSTPVVYCYDDEDFEVAAQIMEDKQIRRLAVLNDQKRLVGIVSLGDLAVRSHDERLVEEVMERVCEPA